ncbi:MAG: DNA-processing protein DprA [Desulfitobacteriaceae bacterium]
MERDLEKGIRATLRTIPGLGSQRLRHLIAIFGSAQAAWEAPSEAFKPWAGSGWIVEMLHRRRSLEPERIEAGLEEKGILTVTPDEAHYPRLLAELSDAPPLLYYKGHLKEGQEVLAMVGSRRATPYGKAAAEFLAREVAASGIAVISGLARGIDTSAHKGALSAQGITWAVLGCGVDLIYPPENRKLAEGILERGALISEFIPGTPPDSPHFPARNRLISGCSRGVVVVEAALKSGAMITVDFALEQGREVFAVPGPIFSEMSKGTNYLLRQGAKIVEDKGDIWAEIPDLPLGGKMNGLGTSALGSLKHKKDHPELAAKTENRTGDHLTILELMSDIPLHIDQIVWHSSLPVERIPLLLLELQLAGEIEQLPGQLYVIARKS